MNKTYRCWPVIDFSLDVQANSEDAALDKMDTLIEKLIDNLYADLDDLGFMEGGGVFESVCTDQWITEDSDETIERPL